MERSNRLLLGNHGEHTRQANVCFSGTSTLDPKELEERIYLSMHTDTGFNFCHKGIHSAEMYAHVFKSISVSEK